MKFTLRPWKTDDIEILVNITINKKIRDKMSDAFPDSKEKWERFIEMASDEKSRLYLAIDIDGNPVGGLGVSPEKDVLKKNAELGYWLSEEYWGKGIMPKAISQIVELAFKKFDIVRIYAAPFGNNPASHRVLEKAGFKLEARFEKIVFKNGEYLDELVYATRKY